MELLQSGEIFAGCRILHLCGRGGYGVVYLAENALGKRVAVKIISTADKERELRGIRCYMERVPESPWLLPVYHVGIERGECFYLMAAADPMPGTPAYLADTLGNRLKFRKRLAPEEALEIVRGIAAAVEVLHRADLLHRDIKPDNIIFVGGVAMLSDPGLICSTEKSVSLAGTFGFLPPEVLSGAERNSRQSDIYALGKVLYCAVTGEAPGRFPHLPRDFDSARCRKLLPVMMKACNARKRRRYADVADFRRALPEHLPQPGKWWLLKERFRVWRLMHHRLWLALLISLLILPLLGGALVWHWRQAATRFAAAVESARRESEDIRQRIDSGGVRLSMELERNVGADRAQELLTMPSPSPTDPASVKRHCAEVRAAMARAALKEEAAAWAVADAWRRSGAVRGFLDSPLAEWLSAEQVAAIREKLAADEKQNLDSWEHLPRPGERWAPGGGDNVFSFVYIPPGEFVSPRTGEPVRIDYPFWVSPTELTGRQFSSICGFLPGDESDLNLPATRILWNDFIYGCWRKMQGLESLAALPPGYIVRPLTEEEWEYCALGGMRGASSGEWSRENSGLQVHPVALCKPNHFGLYDMLGNVREMVFSEDHHPENYVIRGKSFKDLGKEQVERRREIFYPQFFMTNVGARMAVAPGSPDLYERETRIGVPNHVVFKGRHYEFFGQLNSTFNHENAVALCTLFGGHVASLDSPELLKTVCDHASALSFYPICSGAVFRDGHWYWENGKRVEPEPAAPRSGEQLVLRGGEFQLTPQQGTLGFFCEWSEEEWQKRGEWRADPERRKFALTEFELNGRRYALFMRDRRQSVFIRLLRRYAEILGGRLPEPETEEARTKLAARLQSCADGPIPLGGVWKLGQLYWMSSGHPIREALPRAGRIVDPSPSLYVPALNDGTFCRIQQANQFLVEFPDPGSGE